MFRLTALLFIAFASLSFSTSGMVFLGRTDPSSKPSPLVWNQEEMDRLLREHQFGDVQAELYKLLDSGDAALKGNAVVWLEEKAAQCWPVCVYMLARHCKNQLLEDPTNIENRIKFQCLILKLLMLAALGDSFISHRPLASSKHDTCFTKLKWKVWWYWGGEELFSSDNFQAVVNQVATDLKKQIGFIAANISPWWVHQDYFQGVSGRSTTTFLNFDQMFFEDTSRIFTIKKDFFKDIPGHQIDLIAEEMSDGHDYWNDFFDDMKKRPPTSEQAKTGAIWVVGKAGEVARAVGSAAVSAAYAGVVRVVEVVADGFSGD